jgi:hypothetical protein
MVASRTTSYGVSGAAQEFAVRLVGALLAVAVATVHVADQGGITAMASPAWVGWGYRLVEAGGLLVALLLLLPGTAWLRAIQADRIAWAGAVLLGAGPFTGYIASRTVGIPGDPYDVGNWGYWVGTVSLLVEAALLMLGLIMLLALRAAARARSERRMLPAPRAAARARS